MAKEDHLIRFQVENFKRFRCLTLDDLGQFNLLVGDNNVGKNSVLEALLYDDDLNKFSDNLFQALSFRNLGGEYREGHFSFYVNRSSLLDISKPVLSFSLQTLKGDDFDSGRDFSFAENGSLEKGEGALIGDVMTPRYKNTIQAGSVPLIPFSGSYGKDLMDLYSKTFIRDRAAKRELISTLSTLITGIEDLEMDTAITDYPVLVVALKGGDTVVPLVNYGEGTIKLFRILMFILLFKGKRLMIDEIDAGIYYSRMKDFWKTILLAAEENEVQLFVTTHNQECIKYFKEALDSQELNHLKSESRTITLVENHKSKEVKAITSHFDELEHAIEYGNEIR